MQRFLHREEQERFALRRNRIHFDSDDEKPRRGVLLQQALLFEGTNSLSADFHFHLTAINGKSFGLQIRLPHFFSVALRKTDVVAVLLAFTGDITFLHKLGPIVSTPDYIC